MVFRMGRGHSARRKFAARNVYQPECLETICAQGWGLLKLEDQIDEMQDPFMRKGLQLLVDGNSRKKIRNGLRSICRPMSSTIFRAARIWESASGYAPTIGH